MGCPRIGQSDAKSRVRVDESADMRRVSTVSGQHGSGSSHDFDSFDNWRLVWGKETNAVGQNGLQAGNFFGRSHFRRR